MLRIPFLRNILLVSLLFATIFPLYDLYFIIPSYQNLLIRETERASARFVRFLVVSNYLDRFELRPGNIPVSMINEVEQLRVEGQLVKLRIFSPTGEIIFSSVSKEVGTINKKKYFRQMVAKGQLYSKMVHKSSVTAEGIVVDRDLVETYVPIMIEGHFHGALEVYSDITPGQQSLTSLSRQSFLMLVAASAGLLLMTLLLLFRARKNIEARNRAEDALQKSNEVLEERVDQRTIELSGTNKKLAAEISERKKAQLAQKATFIAISEARDRIDAIISSVADALLVTDHQDVVVLMNRAAEELFNVKATDVVGSRLPDVIGFDKLLFEISKARLELRGSTAVEFDFEMENGHDKRVYQGRTSRLKEIVGGGRGLVLLIHDVTHERQIERMKSEFVSMAAHELQTPLTMILGYSELLLDSSGKFGSDEQRNFLRVINDKSIELSRLIDDILDLSRIEDGRGMQLDFARVDVGSLCRHLVADFEGANGRHRFAVEMTDDPLIVIADDARLTQVMDNLLGNAVKYSPNGGLIKVSLNREENWLFLDVVDQGIGMSDTEKAHAFERFYRGDTSNTAVRGTGLGLSISRYIIDAHGGQIEIISSKGEGTRLKVRLPLAG